MEADAIAVGRVACDRASDIARGVGRGAWRCRLRMLSVVLSMILGMPKTSSRSKRSQATPPLKLLAQQLSDIAQRQDVPLREAVEGLAREAITNLEGLWARGVENNAGPIDVIDFFSGCGGMSAGFRSVNGLVPAFRNILAVDINEAANETYEANLGITPKNADVHYLSTNLSEVDEMVRKSGRNRDNPLVVIGCAPCQGFSSHRNSDGDLDGRNGLFVDFARIATHLDPDFIVIENVPEICTDRYWPHVQQVWEMFERCGYDVHLEVHNMAHFGLPQERFRALMFASKLPVSPMLEKLAYSEFRTVRDAIGHLPPVEPGETHSSDLMHQSARHRQSTIDLIRSVPKDGGSRKPNTGPASLVALANRQGKAAFEDVYGRLYWDRPAITITHYSRNPASGRFSHPEQDRGLTVREAALLQGFPARYQFCGGFDARFSQVGNAVPPLVSLSIAFSILGQLVDPPSTSAGGGIRQPLAKSFARLIPALKAKARTRDADLVDAR